MKHLIAIQEWDNHTAYKHVYIDNDTIIATVTVNVFKENPVKTFESLWVKPELRRLGIATIILNDIVEMPMACMVKKDNDIAIRLYEKHDFDYWYDEDENYMWLKNFKENETN